MSAAEKPPNLEELDPRYPLLREYFERGWTLIRLWGVAETSTAEHPVCLCRGKGSCKVGKHPNGTYLEADGTAYVRSLEEAVRKLPPGKPWNVGLPFGQGLGRGWIALDMESDAALEAIRREYRFDPLQAKAWAATGRGYHSVYKLTPEQVEHAAELGMKQGAGKWAVPDVDVRVGGTNGYIVIEPSIHYSGRPYKWEELGEPDYAPDGFLELMATHKSIRSKEPAPAPAKDRTRATDPSSAFPDLSRKRAEKLLESLCAKVTSASEYRNDAVKDAAYAAGAALCLWSESEQDAYRERLKDAAAVQTPPGDPDYEGRRVTVRESWKAGVAKGLQSSGGENGPIPPPDSVPTSSKPSSSSSSASSEEPAEEAESGFRPGLRSIRLDQLGPPQRVEWLEGELAAGRIPRGELSIIMGKPGVGKGSITAQIVAEVTQAGRVVIVSAPEDDLKRVTLPRYSAAGAKLANVIAVGYEVDEGEEWEPVDMTIHARGLLELAQETSAALIVLDPIEEHLRADAKVSQANRDALRPLLKGCRSIGCAILGIDHLNRMASSDGYKRAGGSGAKYQRARSVLIAARQESSDGDDAAAMKPAEVVLIHDKLNLGYKAHGLRFELKGDTVPGEKGELVETVTARLLGETTLTASEVLSEEAQAESEAVAECAEWLRDYLEEKGRAHPLEDTRKDARAVSPDWKAETVNLAIKRLGGKQGPVGFGGARHYKLPGFIPLGEDRH